MQSLSPMAPCHSTACVANGDASTKVRNISDYEGEYYFDYDSDDEGGVRRRKRINQCVDIMV